MKNEAGKIQLEKGDFIKSENREYEIERILSQDMSYAYKPFSNKPDINKPYWDIEFQSINRTYHHWKSYLNGGEITDARTGKIIIAKKLDI
jgi:hypothetical protein